MRYKITLQGRVQGVGFRPFVYRKALELGINGSVSNNEEGVLIFASATPEKVEAFYEALVTNPPAISRVRSYRMEQVPGTVQAGFRIVPSSASGRLNLQLTPDFALCPDCETDLQDPENRRYGYPIISCTNCGPRWALTRQFPFEREHTSMIDFPMCPVCMAEYTDPLDRRFHSQTNSCPECGISYWISETDGQRLDLSGNDCFGRLAEWLETGKILAIKNTSGYLLVCDARKSHVVAELRRRKKRPAKPFALLFPSIELLENELEVPHAAREALISAERPIVLLSAKDYSGSVAKQQVAPDLEQLGVMLPYSGILSLLARAFPHPVVATSGNLHGAPICSTREDAEENLKEVADYFLHHNLDILNAQDDSVLRFGPEDPFPILIRRSRGYAPNFGTPAEKGSGSGLLALGADLKSSIGFIPNDFIYLSQYLGNLENYDVYTRFTRSVDQFLHLFDIPPTAVLTDAHPAYQSVRFGIEWAGEKGIPRIPIQHHRAHFAAVLGEHKLWASDETILGVIWDGVGYGDDGNIWGGEFFTYGTGNMERVGHLEEFPWLAGDKMSREPRLSLFALSGSDSDRIRKKFRKDPWEVYQNLRSNTSLRTSSMGRLFDAVASLLDLCDINSYEGEAAMYLEALAGSSTADPRPLIHLDREGNIPSRGLLEAIENALDQGRTPAETATDFLFTLAGLILEKADREGCRHIAFSGGVFQNALLVSMIRQLNAGKNELYFHQELSPNDENIAYGQLMYYLYCNP